MNATATTKRLVAQRDTGVSKMAMSAAYVVLKSPQRIMVGSHPLDLDLPEESVRLHHQDEDQRHERRDLLHAAAEDRVEVATREVLQDADGQPADDGAHHAVEAAQDHD